MSNFECDNSAFRIPPYRWRTSPHSAFQNGMALIMVIWIMAFLGIVLSAFAFSMRTELDAARSFKEEAEAAGLAEAGVAWAMAELVNKGWRGGGSASATSYDSGDVPLGRGTYRVVVMDEEGKISLNRAPAEVLSRLLRNTGVKDAGLRDTIVDSILDWRDPDNLHHLNGAEEDYYRSLPHPYHPRNGDFKFLEELLLVKGMAREVLYGNVAGKERLAALAAMSPEERDFLPGEYLGIRRSLTVHGSGRVNFHTASLDVLAAMGVPASEALAIVESRRTDSPVVHSPPADRSRWLTTPPRIFLIQSLGSLTGTHAEYRITAILQNVGTRIQPHLQVIAWTEG